MSHPANDLQIHIVVQLHVLGVDAQDLQTSSLIWDSNVNLAVKPPKSPEGSINAAQEILIGAKCIIKRVKQKLMSDMTPEPAAPRKKTIFCSSYMLLDPQYHEGSCSTKQRRTQPSSLEKVNSVLYLLGRLVAPMTMTWDLAFRPSISVRSCETILLSTSPCKRGRFEMISKKGVSPLPLALEDNVGRLAVSCIISPESSLSWEQWSQSHQ